MNILDPNELGMTIVDQAHTIRVQNTRIAELEGLVESQHALINELTPKHEAKQVAAAITKEAKGKE